MEGQMTLFGSTINEQMLDQSIRLLREFEDIATYRNPIGYAVGYSGGKDSDVMLEVFKEAGVKFFVFHNHTTLDAPETVYYIRRKFAELDAAGIPCKIFYPRQSFWSLCRHKLMLPSRIMRFCCSELKEYQKKELQYACHSFGVRKAESQSRAARRDSIEISNQKRRNFKNVKRFHFDNTDDVKTTGMCYTQKYFIVNPLAYWSDGVLWDYIRGNNIEINPLYGQGFCRVGCVGCPMAGAHRIIEFERYPKYKINFIRLCDYIVSERIRRGLPNKYGFKDGREYFEHWLEISPKKAENVDNQITFSLFDDDEQL
jgi:phosphoadenosine phosphosulfate reductase